MGWIELLLRQGNHDSGPSPWTTDALECLLLYPWAGNLRELRAIVLEAAMQSPSFPCGTEHLPTVLRAYREALRARPNAADELTAAHVAAQHEPTKAEIEEALRNTRGHMRTAANQLGIDRRKLYRLCERFGIVLDAYRDKPSEEDE